LWGSDWACGVCGDYEGVKISEERYSFNELLQNLDRFGIEELWTADLYRLNIEDISID